MKYLMTPLYMSIALFGLTLQAHAGFEIQSPELKAPEAKAPEAKMVELKTTDPQPKGFTQARKLEDHDADELFRFGLGFASFGTIGATSGGVESGSISMLFDINAIHSLQILGSISTLKPNPNFGAGLVYRATVSGDRTLGFHLGGLATFGSTSDKDFVAQVGPLLGIHVALFQLPQLQLSLDGGPILRYGNGPDFKFGPLGHGLGGFSIHYFF